ncbi:MAG: hypothetical protein II131_02615 [Neisseriaceae bacterium]|nr:hypothetical protein [Neisseriaceae bacterium]
MNKKEISLYLDGLSSGTETLFLRHLEAINRLSRYEESGVKSWLTAENADSADIFFLGEDHQIDNPLQLCRPILFDGVVPPALRPVAVSVKFPMTSNSLRELMQDAIENFKPIETPAADKDDRKITIRLPERTPPVEQTVEKPIEKPAEQTVEKQEEKPVEKPVEQAIEKQEEKSAEKPVEQVPEKQEEKPIIQSTEQPKETPQQIAGDLPFFEGYLKTYQPKEQTHSLIYKDGKTIYINRLQGKVFADCENIRDLVKILSTTEQPKISEFSDNHDNLRAFPFDAVLWSYGLHAPLFDEIVKKFDVTGQKARLKRWPLFGKWETESKLLFLTTLFTQKAASLREAEVKSGQNKDFVLHFMAAAELAGLPFELEQSNETEDTPITEKKKVGWINSLRQKLNMNNILSGN